MKLSCACNTRVRKHIEKQTIASIYTYITYWPWQDSNLQSLVPKTNALSIRPQGQVVSTSSFPLPRHGPRGVKITQDCPKTFLRRCQDVPRRIQYGSKTLPRLSQDMSRTFSRPPNTSRRWAKTAQDAPKTPSDLPRSGLGCKDQ